jgi:hypothetical protein
MLELVDRLQAVESVLYSLAIIYEGCSRKLQFSRIRLWKTSYLLIQLSGRRLRTL